MSKLRKRRRVLLLTGDAGGGFDPSSLGGLAVWVDASKLLLTDGAAVSSWPNLGTAPNPSFVGTPLPIFKANILNSLPIVRFTAGQGRLRGTHSLTNNWTLIYIVRRWGTTGGRAWGVAYPPANIYVGMHTTRPDVMYIEGAQNNGPETTWSATPPDPWKMYSADCDATLSRFFINGGLVGSNQSGNLTGTWNLSGYDPATAGETGDCDIAEVLLYNRKLLDTERIQVQDYLRGKWGLAAPTSPAGVLITSYTPGAERNDLDGGVGARFGIGVGNVTVNWIGVRCHPGNTGIRTLKLHEWFTRDLVRTVNINLTGATAGTFVWAPVPATVLLANGFYVLLMSTTPGMQMWAGNGACAVRGDIIATVFAAYDVSGAFGSGAQNEMYVGVDLGL
jgi:hypothetical protein